MTIYITHFFEDKPAKTLDSIIGEIEGQLGLCGGISLLNACEFIGILVSFCYKRRRLTKEIKTKKQVIKNAETKEIGEPRQIYSAPKYVQEEMISEDANHYSIRL